jgi:hypothetical protein
MVSAAPKRYSTATAAASIDGPIHHGSPLYDLAQALERR